MTGIQYETVKSPLAPVYSGRIGFVPGVNRFATALVEQLYAWQDRVQQRTHLATIEDHLLKDMGISRADADRESAKPFWRI